MDHVLNGANKGGINYKNGTKCGPFTEKNRPTQEVQHLISSFWAGPRRIWDQKLIFYGPLYSGPFSVGRFRVGGGGGGSPPPPPPVTTPLYEDRLIALDLPSLAYRRKRGGMIMMYKIVNDLVRVDLNDLFTPIPISHNLRGHNKRVFKHHATKRSRVVNNWNTLPAYVVTQRVQEQTR